MDVLIDSTNSKLAGFRLQYLEVLNWGTFNKDRWKIEPNGRNALLTGDIGSGKSTLVDALTCLLVPHNKITFNKAAGAEGKERNLLSYVKGEFKKEKEEITKVAKKIYLRPEDNTYTVIIGNFYNEGYNEIICLAQLFWIGKDSKVEKLLMISTTALSITKHFSGFSDINELRKKLRNIEGIQVFNDNFTQYSEQFRRLFGMNSEKAIDLFYQTVSMKAVSSLTEFVREQMLERTDVKDQISALLKRFDDLKKAHEAVVHAREQYQILKPLTEASVEYGEIIRDIEDIESMLEVVPSWFAEKKIVLLQEGIETLKNEIVQANQKQQQLSRELDDLESKRQGILQDISNNGGKRIEQIADEIKRHENDKEDKKSAFEDYEKLTAKCGLRKIENEADFKSNIAKAIETNHLCEATEKELRETRDNLITDQRKTETEHESELIEYQSLKGRETQIPAWLVRFRGQLCQDLRIDDIDLPFIGELLKVIDEDWEGAIEKLMHDTGISMLVPKNHYRSVSNYVNNNRLGVDGKGIKLTYLETDIENITRVSKELDNNSIVRKVDVKPDTIFCDWLENYLQRIFGDYICTTVQGLQHVPFGITQQGLIKSGRIRHTKDDRKRLDDRRNYVLGWSNTEKIKALDLSINKLAETIEILKIKISSIESKEKSNSDLKLLLSNVLYLKDYTKINWQYHSEKIYQLDKERRELLDNNNKLALLEQNKSDVEKQISDTKQNERGVTEEIGGLKSRLENYDAQKSAASAQAEQTPHQLKGRWFPVIDSKMHDKQVSLRNVDRQQEEFRNQYYGENGELKELRTKQMKTRSSIEKKMREIKDHSKAEYSELTESVDARAEYMKKYEKLVSEDLKRHEERFKDELTKNTINSIAVFDSQLQKHENDIKQKIKTINQHLSTIVYNSTQDTYIMIQMDPASNKDINLFKEDLKKCYTHSFSSNKDLYTEEKYEQVKQILDRFASMESSDKDWTNSVTDVRQWFEFNASERFRADNSEKEFYESSGGKSGGQKEKLAYTILASALAYQFGLQFDESKSRSFRFVVIDEAFGRGSDESTRYGLELFQKLNLQLLIVTPLQKIHVIEGHVNSFHFISNRDGNNSQVSNFTKEEYQAEKSNRNGVFQKPGGK